MDEFDYLNGDLFEWVEENIENPTLHLDFNNYRDVETIRFIQEEYLPRFEAALHRNAVKALSGNVL